MLKKLNEENAPKFYFTNENQGPYLTSIQGETMRIISEAFKLEEDQSPAC